MAARKTTPRATKRKATPAQIAARKLFAERARSGELRKEKTHHAASLARRKTTRAPAVKRAKNPAKSRKVAFKASATKSDHGYLYIVWRADSGGNPVYDIAKFRKLAEARAYGQAYADAHDIPVVVTSKAL